MTRTGDNDYDGTDFIFGFWRTFYWNYLGKFDEYVCVGNRVESFAFAVQSVEIDLVDGHLKAYSHLEKIDNYEVFNLWTGAGTSVLEMVKIVEKISWKKIKYTIESRRNGDLAEVICNPKKANKMLKWESLININESIKNSVKLIYLLCWKIDELSFKIS